MQCFIYRSSRKPDHYIFLKEKDQFDLLPSGLVALLGDLVFVFDLDLSTKKELANAKKDQVIESLQNDGYYLQLPPKDI